MSEIDKLDAESSIISSEDSLDIIKINDDTQDERVAFKKKRAASSANSSAVSSDSSSDISSISSVSVQEKKKLSQEDIMQLKSEILYQFERIEKKGIKLPKKFNMSSNLDDMKQEYERLKKDREVDISIRFQRKMLMTIITGIEYMNGKFDPFDISLDGWSESVNDNINDYDDVFEELHEKYKGKANMPPELKLMMALGGSALMFHLRNSMFKSALPDLGTGPEKPSGRPGKAGGGGGLMSGLMGGLMGGGGIGNILGGIMGSASAAAAPVPPMRQTTQMHAPGPMGQMRGPTNVEDIMKELNLNDERIEALSTMSESDMTDLPYDATSTAGEFFAKKKRGGGKAKRTLEL